MTIIAIVPIGAGRFVILDPEDAEWVPLIGWKYNARGDRSTGYAERKTKPRMMHTVIMQRHGLYLPDLIVDHRNTWGLDNRKCNLRMVTHGENIAGQDGAIHGIGGRWEVHFRGRLVGRFSTELEALIARSNEEAGFGFMTRIERLRAKAELQDVLCDLAKSRLITTSNPVADRIEDQYTSIAKTTVFEQMNERERRDLSSLVHYSNGQWYADGVPVENREEGLMRILGPISVLTCERKTDLRVREHDERFALVPTPVPISLDPRNKSGYAGVSLAYARASGETRFGANVKIAGKARRVYNSSDPLSCAWFRRLLIIERGLDGNSLEKLPDRRRYQRRQVSIIVFAERRNSERRQAVEM